MSPATPIANGAANSTRARTAPAGRRPSSSSSTSGRDDRLEALPHRVAAEGLVERQPLAIVLGRVARQHHHAERRPHEVRLGPDGDVVARPQQLPREPVVGDEPAAERGHPGDGLGSPAAGRERPPVLLLEVGELDRGACREAPAALRERLRLVQLDLRNEIERHAQAGAAAARHHASTPRSVAIAPAAL